MTFDPVSLLIGLALGGMAIALLFLLRRRQADAPASIDPQHFLALAEQQFGKFHEVAKSDLDKRTQAVDSTVTPIAKTLEQLQAHLQEAEKARAGAYGELRQQLSTLAETQMLLKGETSRLVAAMRTPMGRGSWGEMQLYRLLEQVGMVEDVDYHKQLTIPGEDASFRPDVVVNLPGGKSIVIDAKAPLEAYFGAIEAEDEPSRQLKLKAHADQVRKQMKDLSAKEYWSRLPATPEFVVMFLPSEGACASALQYDLDLIEAGMRANVVIATPLTLFALLRTISYGWRQERIAENAALIARLGRELYDRIGGMAENYQALGQSLRKSVDVYNKTLGQMETRVLASARKLKEHHVGGGEIVQPVPVETAQRAFSAAEFLTIRDLGAREE
jgi:DNA recombination protein RmuC